MPHYVSTNYLPSVSELPLTDDLSARGHDRANFARRTLAHLNAAPLRFGPQETLAVMYLEAVGYLVRSYPEPRWEAVWEAYADHLPNTGSSPHDATADAVQTATVALYGLARDRVHNRQENAGMDAWLTTATEAVRLNQPSTLTISDPARPAQAA